MGNPSAAQEPSMEEILASIRQIISEDGDGADQDKETASADEAGEPEAVSDSVDMTAELPEAEADSDQPEPESSSDPFETASVTEPEGGDARSAFETMDSSAEAEDAAPDDLIDTGPYENPFDTFAEKAKEIEAPTVEHEPSAVESTVSETFADTGASEVSEPETAPEPEESAADQPVADSGMSKSIIETESPAMPASASKPAEYESDEKLISTESGASVANAFSALTHTILSQNARTLDDLVSDMLQPMLKEWLDENLPTLVERMVKQEIDRMARGGR